MDDRPNQRRWIQGAAAACVMLAWLAASVAPAQAPALLDPPPADDFTAAGLQAYQARLLAHYGGHRKIPLDVKAAYFEWEMWNYHLTAYHQVYNRVVFPLEVGRRPQAYPTRDSSTWNGALLAALCHQYAATKSPATLAHIGELVRGLHLFFEVTGVPGLAARAVCRPDDIVLDELRPNTYQAADGNTYHYQADPAKGGYNQLAAGYAALFMYAFPDLPPEIQRIAREDLTQMVLHVIDHGYRLTGRDGQPTTYGDLRPLAGSMSIPFNAQVAYTIVALGYSFPPEDADQRERIRAQFVYLRGEHHVYYEDPWRSLIQPQRIGGSPFVKGMNDRNHVTNAAFVGLCLELDHAERHGEPFNEKFVYQLGQTMYWSMEYLYDQRNSLCSFMWGALLSDPQVARAILHRRDETAVRARLAQALAEGVEQLRRFPLDRFSYDGPDHEMPDLQWIDDWRADDSYWKCSPYLRHERTGPAKNMAFCAMDYLYAYWLYRHMVKSEVRSQKSEVRSTDL